VPLRVRERRERYREISDIEKEREKEKDDDDDFILKYILGNIPTKNYEIANEGERERESATAVRAR